MDDYIAVMQRFGDFSGRSRRREYWMFHLVNWVLSVLLVIVVMVAGVDASGPAILLACAYGLGILIPTIAVHVRRLHDTGKSGWWLLLSMVPLGGLVLFFFSLQEGDAGPNQYGPDPKAVTLYA